jgi:DNA-binding NtrC family response regulator
MTISVTGDSEVFRDARVMIASPSERFRQSIEEQLGPRFGDVTLATGGADALAKLDEGPCRFLVLDRRLADLNADELEEMIHALYPGLEILTLDSEDESQALQAISLPGPESADDTTETTAGEPEVAGLDTEPSLSGPREPDERWATPLPGMIGSARAMARVFRLARLVAPRSTTVLVMGETGTGKELVARAIHDLSQRAQDPFVTVNCAAIPEALLEAELFGHSRGAFTGAVQSRLGRIHAAHGGTLFLDEAGELPLGMQAKLLRFLQHGEVQRLGSSDVFRVDVRVVAATNADLSERVGRGEFRADLYYRLSIFPIRLPPLRERAEDIVPIALNHLDSLCREASSHEKRLTRSAEELLRRHSWPGNVRELQHAVERAFILSEDSREISADLFHLSE